MITQLLAGFGLALGVACPVGLYALDRVRRREALFRWASANGLRVVKYS